MRLSTRLSQAILALVLALPFASRATVYEATSAFSPTANPNGLWSYGFSTTLGGTMMLDPERASDNGIDVWRTNLWLGAPSVFYNGTSQTLTNSTGTLVVPAGGLGLYPGPGGQYSLLRFTAPAEGTYQVAAAFSGLDIVGTTTDVHILSNGTSLFDGQVNGYGPGPTASIAVTLKAGDSIDFAVGWGANQEFSWDATGLSAQITAQSSGSACLTPPAGLVAWWPGNGNANDIAGGITGSLYDGTSFAPGEVDQAFSFDGVRNCVTNSVPGLTNILNSYTMEFWAWPTAERASSPQATSGFIYGTSNQRYAIYPAYGGEGTVGAGVSVGSNGISVFEHGLAYLAPLLVYDAPLLGWTHIAVVYNHMQPSLYVNGSYVKTGLVSTRVSCPSTWFGGGGARGGNYGYYAGLLDEVSIYNRPLAAGEIQAIYTAGSVGKCVSNTPPAPECVTPPAGLVSWWRGESNTLDSVEANNGTFVNGATFAPAWVGQGFSFYGSNYVRVPSAATLNPQGSFSLEAWVYPLQDSSRQQLLVGKWGDNFELANQRSYALTLQPGRAVGFSISDAAHQTDSAFHAFATDANTVALQTWSHIVAVYDQSSGIRRIYVNGLQAKARTNAPITVLAGTAPLSIGAWHRAATWLDAFFKGAMDEVSFYKRALSDAEIQGLYRAGITGKCTEPPVVVSQPVSQSVLEGSNVTFCVTAAGNPVLHYQWLFNGTNLAGATGPTLTLTHVQWTDSGSYAVVVANAFGTAVSSNVLLAVDRFPVAQCASVVVAAGPECTAAASVDQGSFDPDGDPLSLSQSPPGPYPLGTNLVTLTVADNRGASNTCTALVIVLDQTPPTLLGPADILVTNAHHAWTSIVTYAPSAADNCSGVGRPVCEPPSGTAFGLGTHTVSSTVTDAAGNVAHGSFKVTVLPGNVPPVPVIHLQPLAQFPDHTNLLVIAPDNQQATVVLDGSQSYDADDASFLSWWYGGGTNLLGTNLVSTCVLGLGTNELTLWLDDTFPLGTNSASVTVEVITPAQAVSIVAGLLRDFRRPGHQGFLMSLNAARAAFNHRDFKAGLNQLWAFQNKVRVQIGPVNPALAEALIQSAQQIIDALAPAAAPGHARVRMLSLTHQQGKMHLKFAGPAGKVHLVQASTNMVTWQTIGTATDRGDGSFEFEDTKAAGLPARFYRIVAP